MRFTNDRKASPDAVVPSPLQGALEGDAERWKLPTSGRSPARPAGSSRGLRRRSVGVLALLATLIAPAVLAAEETREVPTPGLPGVDAALRSTASAPGPATGPAAGATLGATVTAEEDGRERKRDGTFREGAVKERYRQMSTAERFPGTDRPERYEEWVDRVFPLITDRELDYFLALREDYRRESFMVAFWDARDPNPGTSRNELKLQWRSRADEALSLYGTLDDARAVVFLFNGPPGRFRLRDGRILSRCFAKSDQLEVWFYGGSDQTQARFAVIFLRRANGRPYEIWYPGFSLSAWARRRLPTTNPRLLCAEEFLPLARQLISSDPLYSESIRRWTSGPEAPEEWLETFQASTSELPDGAETFPAEVRWDFSGRNQNRTTMQGVVTVPYDQLTSRVFAGRELVHLVLTGEILRNDRVFEQFRYRFELPVPPGVETRERIGSATDVTPTGTDSATGSGVGSAGDDVGPSEQAESSAPVEPPPEGDSGDGAAAGPPPTQIAGPTDGAAGGGTDADGVAEEGESSGGAPTPPREVPLVVTRYLRPGDARVLIKVEDVFGDRYGRVVSEVEVPRPEDVEDSARTLAEAFPFLAEALEAAERGERYLKLVPPHDPNAVQYGVQRFETQAVGDFDEVVFYLDDEAVLTKRSPPFAVSLNLGTIPGLHRIRVAGMVDGRQVATDELTINQGGQRFKVRLTEPSPDIDYTDSARAVAKVQIPDASQLDRVEIYLDEKRVATLYQEPFISSFALEKRGLSIVRAVAFLTDGSQTEDVAFVNGPDYIEEIDVQYVQVYASIVDRQNRAILDLGPEDVTVEEDGVPQTLTRFEFVQDLPVHVGLLIDTSTSMEEDIERVRMAAERFVTGFVRPKDRVTVMSFDTKTQNRIGFTNVREDLIQALAGLEASGSTALYDAAIYALSYFDGITSQRAVLLLSDGEDESSLFDFDRTVEVARRSGVAVFAIGLGEDARERDSRRVLQTLAEETGGRAFFIDSVDELEAIYDEIDEDLRTRYLMVYQSTSDKDESEFRAVDVRVDRRGAEVRTMSGYYP